MLELLIRSGDGGTTRVPLSKTRVTIGRSRESDVVLPDQWLSRQHAEIRQEGPAWLLRDLGSKNGTTLNGETLTEPRALRPGDEITLGEHVLTIVDEDLGEPEEKAPEGTRVFSLQEMSELPSVEDGEQHAAGQQRMLRVLSGSVSTLLEHQPLDKVFMLVLDLLLEAVNAERGAILLLEGQPPALSIKATRSRKGMAITSVSRSITRRALAERVCLLLPNLMDDVDFRGQDSILSTGIRSAVCAPLLFTSEEDPQGTVIGLVYLDSSQAVRTFDESDLNILTMLAKVAAAKIENARLLEEILEKRRMEDDMRQASAIQRSLLPASSPVLPGYSVIGLNRPSQAVGGDYFDFQVQGPELLFALGDVSGKGTPAALLMAVLRAAVRAHWLEDDNPQEVVSRINRTVCQNIPEGKYVTFFIGYLDVASGRVRYVNAGHLPPLLVRKDGTVERLGFGGLVLGMFPGVPYEQGSAELNPGDLLAVFSDGITETWDPEGAEFGDEGLEPVLVASRHHEAAAIEEAVLRALDAFSHGGKATDDRTLIVIKRV